jgi:alpha,alpha-trehalase
MTFDETACTADGRTIEQWAQAVIFDLDGVITDTAEAHARAWKTMFDDFLKRRAERRQEPFDPFDDEGDYLRYVDGKPRYDGVASFLASRGIELAYGSPDDPPGRETVCGLGNRKNQIYRETIEQGGVKVFPSSVRFIRRLRSRDIRTAVVSSSKNCRQVLEAAEIQDLFDARVDGVRSAQLGLPGKPAPDIFLQAAKELGVSPEQAVVVEDAIAGVTAGHRGGFGCVIGVDRTGQGQAMQDHGADWVVNDIAEIDGDVPVRRRNASGLPSALNRVDQILDRRDGRRPVLFLDYDGTLTPIVDHPDKADLPGPMKKTLATLAQHCTVAIVSGRGLADVKKRVGLDDLTYAGSHGFEIEGPQTAPMQNEKGVAALPALDAAESDLQRRLANITGALVERKRFSIAVHYRNVAPQALQTVEEIVDVVHRDHAGLRKNAGKKIFELQPDVAWNKGRAVLWLMEQLNLDDDRFQPIYIGDDVTDEDAFRSLRGRGVGILVHEGEVRQTEAEYGLSTTQEVQAFLDRLSAAIDGDDR